MLCVLVDFLLVGSRWRQSSPAIHTPDWWTRSLSSPFLSLFYGDLAVVVIYSGVHCPGLYQHQQAAAVATLRRTILWGQVVVFFFCQWPCHSIRIFDKATGNLLVFLIDDTSLQLCMCRGFRVIHVTGIAQYENAVWMFKFFRTCNPFCLLL